MGFILHFLADHFDAAQETIHDAIVSALPDACDTFISQAQSAGLTACATGSLQQGFYQVHSQNDTYADAVSAAQAVNPAVHILDECDAPEMDTKAHVGNVTEHSVYIEFGTAKMAAQPYFFSTADQVHDQLVNTFAQAVSDAISNF